MSVFTHLRLTKSVFGAEGLNSSLLLYLHRHPCGVTGVCREAKLFPRRVGARPPSHGALESRGGVQSAGDLHPAPGAVPAWSHLIRARRPTWNLSDTDTHGCTSSEIRPLGRLQNQQQLHTGGSGNAHMITHTYTRALPWMASANNQVPLLHP